MNYSRDLNSMDPLPKVTGRKTQPELEDVKPTPEEQFERGDHKPLDEADRVARDTVAGSRWAEVNHDRFVMVCLPAGDVGTYKYMHPDAVVLKRNSDGSVLMKRMESPQTHEVSIDGKMTRIEMRATDVVPNSSVAPTGSKSLWDAVDNDPRLVEKVWEKPVVMGVMVDRRGTIALREYDSVHEACIEGLKLLDDQVCHFPYSITLVDKGEVWHAPDSWGGRFSIDVVRQSLGKFLNDLTATTGFPLDANALRAYSISYQDRPPDVRSACDAPVNLAPAADVIDLQTIAQTVQGWLDFQLRERLPDRISPDDHIMRVPEWPRRQTLVNWVKRLNETAHDLDDLYTRYHIQSKDNGDLRQQVENLSLLCAQQQARIAELECALRDGSGVIAGDESRVQLPVGCFIENVEYMFSSNGHMRINMQLRVPPGIKHEEFLQAITDLRMSAMPVPAQDAAGDESRVPLKDDYK